MLYVNEPLWLDDDVHMNVHSQRQGVLLHSLTWGHLSNESKLA